MLRRIAVLCLAMALGAAACGGDDGDGNDTGGDGGGGGATVTQAPGEGAPSGSCDVIQVLLKLDVTEEQREDVSQTLDGIEGVSHELVEAASDSEPSMFLVTPESDRASDAVGSALAGHPAVVSVVFPEQLC